MLITFADTMNILNEKKVYDEAVERLEAAKEDYLSYYNKYQDQIASGADESSPDLISLGSAVRKAKREALNALNDAKDAKQNLLIAMDEAVAKSSNKKGKDKRKAAEKQRSINKAITEADNWYMKQRNDIDSYVLDTEADTKKIRESVDDQKRMTILANYVKLYREMLEKKEELRLLPISDPSVREERLQLKEAKSDLEDKLDTLEQKNPALAADFEEQRKKLNNKVSNNYKDERANAKLDQEERINDLKTKLETLMTDYRSTYSDRLLAKDQGDSSKYTMLSNDLNNIEDKALSTLRNIKRLDQDSYDVWKSRWETNKSFAPKLDEAKHSETFINEEVPQMLNDLENWIQSYRSNVIENAQATSKSEKTMTQLRMDRFESKIKNCITELSQYELPRKYSSRFESCKEDWKEVQPGSIWRLSVSKGSDIRQFLKNGSSVDSILDNLEVSKDGKSLVNPLYVVRTKSSYSGQGSKYITGYEEDPVSGKYKILSAVSISEAAWTDSKEIAESYALGLTGSKDSVVQVTNLTTARKLLLNKNIMDDPPASGLSKSGSNSTYTTSAVDSGDSNYQGYQPSEDLDNEFGDNEIWEH